MENKQLAIYIEGQTCIQDTVNNKTGKSSIYGKDVNEYPGAEIVPLDYACDRINEALKDKYPMLCPVEITVEQFYEMFECLPPMHMGKTPDGWSFKMSEMTFNDITSGYVCKGDKYYQMNCRLKTKAEEMIAVCA